MDSNLASNHKQNETANMLPTNSEGHGATKRLEDERIDALSRVQKQPIETNPELAASDNVQLSEENYKAKESSTRSRGIPKRYVLLFLVFLGFVNIYGLRVNLNVALVAMVNNRTYTSGGIKVKEPAEFHWNSKTQGDPHVHMF